MIIFLIEQYSDRPISKGLFWNMFFILLVKELQPEKDKGDKAIHRLIKYFCSLARANLNNLRQKTNRKWWFNTAYSYCKHMETSATPSTNLFFLGNFLKNFHLWNVSWTFLSTQTGNQKYSLNTLCLITLRAIGGGGGKWIGRVGRKYYYTGGLGGKWLTKCSVQESFIIKIVYTGKSECLFFFFL